MAELNNLPIPQEVPWKLVATNQVLKQGEPEDATISIFYYEPSLNSLDEDYPDDRLVYLKFTLSVCPPFVGRSTLGSIGERFLSGALPVRHVMFDVGVTPEPFVAGGIRPYFHSASPLRRTMIETGVIGRQVAEAEAESIAMGRSGSQLLETVSSYTPNGLDREDVHSLEEDRQITNREASQERRELLSHITHVDNILTLLSAKHVGSPYLRFNLWPRPISSLVGDETDPDRWYQELLRRHSSGIEGIQEVIAVVVVPRGQPLCLQTRMRRICVLDAPPIDPNFGYEPLFFGPIEFDRVLGYLYRTYPRGTSIDDLDVNLWPQINDKYGDEATHFVRPAVTAWREDSVFFNNRFHTDVRCDFRVPYAKENLSPFRTILYKTMHEVWLEMRRAEYEEALARSPLERGLVMTFDTRLHACVGTASSSGDFSHERDAPRIIDFEPNRHQATGGLRLLTREFDASPIHTWDDLDEQLRLHLNSTDSVVPMAVTLDNPRVVRLLLSRLEALHQDDPRNLSLDAAAEFFGLDKGSIKALRATGACDLRSVAEVLNAAMNDVRDECRASREKRAREELARRVGPEKTVCVTPSEPVEEEDIEREEWISRAEVNRICAQIGAALKASVDSGEVSCQ